MKQKLVLVVLAALAVTACVTLLNPPTCKESFAAAKAEHEAAGRELVDASEDGVQGAFTWWDRKDTFAYREMFVRPDNAPPADVAALYPFEGECTLPNGQTGHHYRGKVPVVNEPQQAAR